jgi:hypothetical protein
MKEIYFLYKNKTLQKITMAAAILLLGSHVWLNATLHNFLLHAAHPTSTMAHEGTPQNFPLQKGGTKQYIATINASPTCKSFSYID